MTKVHFAHLATCMSLLGALCLFGGVAPASADTIDYVVTSTYDSTTSTSPLSAPGMTFSVTFSEPDTLTSLDTYVPVTYSLGGTACGTFCSGSATAEVQFFANDPTVPLYGLFNLVINTTDGDTYLWQFFGPQIYSASGGMFSLMTGTFDINGAGSTPLSTFDNTSLGMGGSTLPAYSGTFTGGTVVATESTTVPEPYSLLLLGLGLLGLGSLRQRFLRV